VSTVSPPPGFVSSADQDPILGSELLVAMILCIVEVVILKWVGIALTSAPQS